MAKVDAVTVKSRGSEAAEYWRARGTLIHRDRVAPGKKQFARMLRRHQTPQEVALWARIRREQLGAKFRRQHVLFGWIADFWCPSHKLVIEVDGPYHRDRQREDQHRDSVLQRWGIRTLRVTNDEVEQNIDEVCRRIATALSQEGSRP